MDAWQKITVPGHVIGLGVDGVLIYVGTRKGGWWHILTVIGVLGALSHAGAIVMKVGQPAVAPVKV